jgi:hypothetical protein
VPAASAIIEIADMRTGETVFLIIFLPSKRHCLPADFGHHRDVNNQRDSSFMIWDQFSH